MNRYRNSAAAVLAVLLAASCSSDRSEDTLDPPHDENQTPAQLPPAGGAKILAKSLQETPPVDEDAPEDAGEGEEADADPVGDEVTPGEGDAEADPAEAQAEAETEAAPPAAERVPEPIQGGAFRPQAGVDSFTAMMAQLEAMNRASLPEIRALAEQDLEAWEAREAEAAAEAEARGDEEEANPLDPEPEED